MKQQTSNVFGELDRSIWPRMKRENNVKPAYVRDYNE